MAEEHLFGDAYQPAQIARRVEGMGVAKARADSVTLFVLAVLAGAFISLGALFFTVVMTEAPLGLGFTRLLGGLSFCLGLVLVVIGGAELFTGNNLLAMAWASRLISTRDVLRNWCLVYLGNVMGCLGTVLLVVWAGTAGMGGGAVGDMALQIARSKADLSLGEAFARGIPSNALVCLAVWLAMCGHSVTDKVLALLLPISAFVTLGFEQALDRELVLSAIRARARWAGPGVDHGCCQKPCSGERRQHRRRNAAGRRRVLARLPARREQPGRPALLTGKGTPHAR